MAQRKPRIDGDAQHDHGLCIGEALSAAEQVCRERKLALTPVRRRVLEIVWNSHEPVGAYEVLAKLAAERRKAAPPTVYRALEFLMAAGLVHRISSLNAFLGCASPQLRHVGQFLVCRACKRVAEIDDPAVPKLLAKRAEAEGFQLEMTSVEVTGLCGSCAAAAAVR
jgi:Fur family zinc uptake transcriptional regulator